MSEVKRYGIGTYTDAHKFGEKADGDYILASDYDTREKQWKEAVWELIDSVGRNPCTCVWKLEGKCWWCVTKDVAFALLNDQPQEDKSHAT